MTVQRAIRFPDDLHAAIETEARRLGHPHTFSSVIVNAARRVVEQPSSIDEDKLPHLAKVMRGSPSPSLERARKQIS